MLWARKFSQRLLTSKAALPFIYLDFRRKQTWHLILKLERLFNCLRGRVLLRVLNLRGVLLNNSLLAQSCHFRVKRSRDRFVYIFCDVTRLFLHKYFKRFSKVISCFYLCISASSFRFLADISRYESVL